MADIHGLLLQDSGKKLESSEYVSFQCLIEHVWNLNPSVSLSGGTKNIKLWQAL